MKKSFQKSLIAASVGIVLAAGSFAANAADNLLFPYVTTKAGAYTFVSVSNNGVGDFTTTGPTGKYHTYYMTKPIGAPLSQACNHFDAQAKTTANDVMQFEVANKINMATTFGDTTSTPVTLIGSPNVEGFMIIAADTPAAGALYHGEATLVDASTGLFFSYSTANLTAASGGDPDYTTGLTDSTSDKAASFYPASAVSTAYYILPTGVRSLMANTAGGGLTATINAGPVGSTTALGAYDMNENFFSGSQSPKVTCFGFVANNQLLQPSTVSAVVNGGQVITSRNLGATGTVPNSTGTGFLQYKVQSSTALGNMFTTISRDTAN